MLLYALLHLTGYDVSMDDLKNFRQWESNTPGHPEYGDTPGVEVTTGPLGQGFGNGVGFAVAEAHMAAVTNKEGHKIVDHFTYAIVTDGDLMEGVASEAASLAGHLGLGKLIYLYDDNHISIEGDTAITFTENVQVRFDAYGWHTLVVQDGNDVEEINQAIKAAKSDPRPSLILCKTIIGFGMPNKQDTAKAHGEPPGEAELMAAKEALGWPVEPLFFVPEDVAAHFQEAVEDGAKREAAWREDLLAFTTEHPEAGAEFKRRMYGDLPEDWSKDLPVFDADPKGSATRGYSGKVLNALALRLPELIGGSADLAGSNKSWINNVLPFSKENPEGRNFHFGVREHGMGAVANGMAVHGGVIPYAATFLVFSDYVRPSIRLSALSHYPVIWVFSHDSIGLGEDGPTHQPVEHLLALRAIPNLDVIRPADGNETREAWKAAVQNRSGPSVIVLTRQNVPELDRSIFGPAEGVRKGAYVLADLGDEDPEVILMASGSEVSLIIEAGLNLVAEGVNVRLVSFPSWELFEKQDQAYRDAVLPPHIGSRIAVEAGVTMGWERWTGGRGLILGLDHFGASAPYEKLYEEFGLSISAITTRAERLVRENQVDEMSSMGRYSWMGGDE
jgi:transketolase